MYCQYHISLTPYSEDLKVYLIKSLDDLKLKYKIEINEPTSLFPKRTTVIRLEIRGDDYRFASFAKWLTIFIQVKEQEMLSVCCPINPTSKVLVIHNV